MIQLPFGQLTNQICNLLASRGLDASGWRIHCLSTEVWRASDSQGGGFTELLDEIALDSSRMAASKPILALGLLPLSEIRHRVAGIADRRQILLLDWPGFAYLHYGFGADELLATARRLVEGACNPLPTGVCPAVPDVLRLTSEVRHWLENRRRNVDGARRDFESAERGEIVLDRAYFEPVEAISDAHRAMLGRLLVLEPLASRHAPRVDGLKGIHAAVNGFEELWVSLESTRAELRRSRPAPALLAAAAKAHRLVVEALTAAIDRTHEVDCELMSTRSTDDAPSS